MSVNRSVRIIEFEPCQSMEFDHTQCIVVHQWMHHASLICAAWCVSRHVAVRRRTATQLCPLTTMVSTRYLASAVFCIDVQCCTAYGNMQCVRSNTHRHSTYTSTCCIDVRRRTQFERVFLLVCPPSASLDHRH